MRITQCRLKGRVTEIHLNFLQGIALMQQQRCTGVAQIVKTDFLETVPLDKAAKTIADPFGSEQTAVCQCKVPLSAECRVPLRMAQGKRRTCGRAAGEYLGTTV